MIINSFINFYLDQDVRWNSTYEMLYRFDHLYSAIESSILISDKLKKDKNLRFSEQERQYIKDTIDIFKIFKKPSTILQGQKYPTISFIFPYIYLVRVKLESKKNSQDLVSLYLILLLF